MCVFYDVNYICKRNEFPNYPCVPFYFILAYWKWSNLIVVNRLLSLLVISDGETGIPSTVFMEALIFAVVVFGEES